MSCDLRIIVVGLSLSLAACGGTGCPLPEAPAASRAEWAARLAAMRELRLDATRSISIKRDVHTLIVHADADRVATAFHHAMRDPARRFGMIEVNRPEAEVGKPFRLGSRFQGRYRLDAGSKLLRDLSEHDSARAALCELENQNTSDYGVIRALSLPPETRPEGAPPHPPPGTTYVLEYHYLEGSPIAGSSRFEVRQVADDRSELTQIFTYQEKSAAFAAFFANGGLTLHVQVVYAQVQQTAELLGVKFEAPDIPVEYTKL